MVWGVNAKDEIYRRTGSSWQKISGGLKVVSCGQPGVWGVNKEDMIYYRTGTFGGGARYINYKFAYLVFISITQVRAQAGSQYLEDLPGFHLALMGKFGELIRMGTFTKEKALPRLIQQVQDGSKFQEL